jgi:hypothetical protein
MSELIDRASWAICPSLLAALHGEQRQCKNCPAIIQTQLGPGTQYCRHVAEKAARAAIAAMREPTEDMLLAGAQSPVSSGSAVTLTEALDDEGIVRCFHGQEAVEENGRSAVASLWESMIGAALAQGIDARSGETGTGSTLLGESPVANGDALKA